MPVNPWKVPLGVVTSFDSSSKMTNLKIWLLLHSHRDTEACLLTVSYFCSIFVALANICTCSNLHPLVIESTCYCIFQWNTEACARSSSTSSSSSVPVLGLLLHTSHFSKSKPPAVGLSRHTHTSLSLALSLSPAITFLLCVTSQASNDRCSPQALNP